jgi:hypothetical protein
METHPPTHAGPVFRHSPGVSVREIPGFGPMALDRLRSRVRQERIREIEARASLLGAILAVGITIVIILL